jgi:hypothetical protein
MRPVGFLEDRTVKYACQYAIIQFLPFVETGEFANVGVVLVCPDTGYFDFAVDRRGWGHISEFFFPLDRPIYTAAIERLNDDLDRIKALTKGYLPGGELEARWIELGRRRDGIVRYAPARAILADDPAKALADLFARYVERNFVTAEYPETLLERTVRGALIGADLAGQFKNVPLGPDYFRIRLPFVQMDGDHPVKAIKPLFLAHDEPKNILLHGGAWRDRLLRLKKHRCLPDKILIPSNRPTTDDLRAKAYQDICVELENEGFEVSQISDLSRITGFARSEPTRS